MSGLLSRLVRSLAPRDLRLALVVMAAGILVSATPYGWDWEQDFGLTWLFRLRGPIDPPRDVIVVTIDRESSERFGLSNKPRKWPRDLHGQLVDRLSQAGASVVVFDIMFQESRDADRDRSFADAIRRAGNVVLFEHLKREFLPMDTEGRDDSVALVIEELVPPIRVLADSALELAPFTLPKVPVKVSQVWLFKPEAGDAPTLPILALRVHAKVAHEALLALIEGTGSAAQGAMIQTVREAEEENRIGDGVCLLRELFLNDPLLSTRLMERIRLAGTPEASRDRLNALICAYGGPNSLHLNFYGPPRSIETVPFHRILDAAPGEYDLSGRAVFVGAAARMQPEQLDGFYTTYTQETGLDVSGVEIAATTFANLLARDWIRPLAPVWEFLVLGGWGLLLGLVLRRFPGGWIPVVALTASGAYLGGAYTAFIYSHLWMPLVTPLLIQLPVATFGGLLWRYRDIQRERENIRRAFGMHLPLSAVDQLARGIDDFKASTEHAFGICIATDAEQYTTLAERLEPAALKKLMNDYYGAIFPPVRDRGGVVADVTGDAMMAIWAAGNEGLEPRRLACEAALDILDAVDAFNQRNSEYRLPTRLGLHCGELVLGYVGAVDHYEYRAVGDIVNTASRIEGLNKQLGTKLLASADLADGLIDFRLRELGRFLLKGKTRPLAICELVGARDRAAGAPEEMYEAFSKGLQAFTTGNWHLAIRCFEFIEQTYGRDGPSSFYLGLCNRCLSAPPSEDWNGIVKIESK